MRRGPVPAPPTVNTAPNAIQSGLRSEMGLAVAMLPPRVPVLRIWRPAGGREDAGGEEEDDDKKQQQQQQGQNRGHEKEG